MRRTCRSVADGGTDVGFLRDSRVLWWLATVTAQALIQSGTPASRAAHRERMLWAVGFDAVNAPERWNPCVEPHSFAGWLPACCTRTAAVAASPRRVRPEAGSLWCGGADAREIL